MNWDNYDMCEAAIQERMRLKAAPRKFADHEEMVLVGWILYNDLAMLSTTTSKFREFVSNYFGKTLLPSFISKFMSRWRLSLKLVGNASKQELLNRENVIAEAADFLSMLERFQQEHAITKDQIKTVDKTYLFTSPYHRHVRHIGPRGSIKSRKVTSDRGAGMILIYSFAVLRSYLIC